MPLVHLLRSNTFSGERILPALYQTVFPSDALLCRLAVGISAGKKNRGQVELTFSLHAIQLNAQVEGSLLRQTLTS